MLPVVALVLFGLIAVIVAAVKRKISIVQFVSISVIVAFCFVFYAQITILTVPPTEEVPQGSTLIISRLRYFEDKTGFIDTVDAVCKRTQGTSSSFCQQVISNSVSDNTKIYMRLPYSRFLYSISTIPWPI
jgi:hypothetical protein